MILGRRWNCINVSKSFNSIDLTKHHSQHSAQTHSLVSFLDQFKKTLIIVHPDCPQRYYAYLLQFDSNVKNPSITVVICIGNSMICSGIYTKYLGQIMLLFVYTTTHKRFVIFTWRYFKLSWNTTALSQSNCRNFSCSGIIPGFFGQAVFLLTVFHCIIFCIDFDMFMRTSFVPTLYCYLS